MTPAEKLATRYPLAMRMVDEGTASPQTRRAVDLFLEGKTGREIAETMGVSRSYAYQFLDDPTGEKCRARKKQGTCDDCGTAIYSDRPSRGGQRRCSPCQHAYERANGKWNAERVVEAIQRWAALYGKPPAASDWNGQGNAVNVARYRAGDFPPLSQVNKRFRRWSDAIRAAGFEPRHKTAGRPRNNVSDDEYRAMARMRAEGNALAEIARHFGINEPAARERLRRWDARQQGGRVPATLSAETVIEREIKRFEARKARAEQEAKDAGEQIERLELALSALNGTAPTPLPAAA